MRRSVPAVVALAIVGLWASPAAAAAVFVETNPSTVRAGDELGVRASCTDNLKEAIVSSPAFGTVTVKPSFGFLTATTRVPSNIQAGDYRVSLTCPDKQNATGTLHVVRRVEPTRGPATGFGGAAPGQSAPLMIGGGAVAIAAGVGLALFSARRRRVG